MFLEQNQMQWEIIDENLERAIVGFDDSLMQTIVKFKEGGIGYLHHHIHSQAAYIAKGTFEVQIENEKKILKSGDVFFINSQLMHGVVCLEEGVLVECFSPKREDFLEK